MERLVILLESELCQGLVCLGVFSLILAGVR